MADHNKPVLTSTYANFVSELDARFDDLSLGLDPAVTTATNVPVNTLRWNSVLGKDQKWNGSSWIDKSNFYAMTTIRVNNGSASDPAISFNDEPNTGIFRLTPQTLAIAVLGQERLRATNTGAITFGKFYSTESMGVGSDPSTWPLPALEFFNGALSSLSGPYGQINLTSNATATGSVDIGATTWRVKRGSAGDLGHAARYTMTGPNHEWYSSTSANQAGDVVPFKLIMTANSDGITASSRLVAAGAVGNDYNSGSIEISTGRTDTPSVLPTLGFYQPNGFAGSLRQNDGSTFGFYTQGGISTANLTVSGLFATNAVYATNGFITTNYLTGVRNPIWRFGDAQLFGISYFQGTAGYNGEDSIGVHFGTLNGGSATGQDSHVTFNENGVFAKRFGGVADQSEKLVVGDPEDFGNPRNLSHITPRSSPKSIRAEFATGTGTGSLYSGVITFSPYAGTTESTAGPSYQLAFGSTQNNGGTPQLRIRNGIDTTWNSWYDVHTRAELDLVGTIIYTASISPPAGYLKANGASVSRATYSRLFGVIGTWYGSADGNTFKLPDLRGEFIRGWDDSRGLDAGRSFGSVQFGSVESHSHAPPAGLVRPWLTNSLLGVDGEIDGSEHVTGNDRTATAGNTQAYGGSETRPRNVALLACIKY